MKPNKLSLTLALIAIVVAVQAVVCFYATNLPLIEFFGNRFYLWLCLSASFTVPILFLHFYSNHWLRKHKYIR